MRAPVPARYEGDAGPVLVIVDFELMPNAPAHLARAGVGDVISCYTAVWDWGFATERGHAPVWNGPASEASETLIDGLEAQAAAIQGDRQGRAQAILDRSGVRYRAVDLGITEAEFGATLRRLGRDVEVEDRWYSIANELEVDDPLLRDLWAMVR